MRTKLVTTHYFVKRMAGRKPDPDGSWTRDGTIVAAARAGRISSQGDAV
jgi:hypothetical protein